MTIGIYTVKKAFKMPYWCVFLGSELISSYHGTKMDAIQKAIKLNGERK